MIATVLLLLSPLVRVATEEVKKLIFDFEVETEKKDSLTSKFLDLLLNN